MYPPRDLFIDSPLLSTSVIQLKKSLENETPEQQRQMIGELMCLLIDEFEPFLAPKITGMLLELDQSDVIHLLESPETLKAKVEEAKQVLGDWLPEEIVLILQEDAEFFASMLPPKL